MPAIKPLLSILRSHHCRCTHHRFAIDALEMVQTLPGRRLARILLQHYDRYLIGSTDPDTRFRDYQNHVIHVTDGYWGGAPRVAHQWYDRLQKYLRSGRLGDAAHAAGVLSHYFTDPMQPLHTQQCSRERILHRPIEWSIGGSYNEILQYWTNDDMRVVFQLSGGPGWLGEAMLHGARFANRKYDQLLDGYDLVKGATHPQAGLDASLRASLAELFGLAITGLARVLERAAWDAERRLAGQLPTSSLVVPTLRAVLFIPHRRWISLLRHRRAQRAVQALMEEFMDTGELRHNLPAEVDIVHRVVQVHTDEKRWKQQREQRLASKHTVVDANISSPHFDDDSQPATVPFVPRRRGSKSSPLRRSA